MTLRHAYWAAVTAAAILTLAACGSASSPTSSASSSSSSAQAAPVSTAKGTPIVVGSVNALSGPVTFPEASAAAAAVFKRVNAQGGINGHPIKYIPVDDGSDATKGAAAARQLVSSDHAVGMVGSASLLECAINSKFYAASHIYSIMGTGVDPVCYASPNIAPVNDGPYQDLANTLYYLSNVVHKTPLCWINQNVPALQPGYNAALKEWETVTGKKLAAFLPIDPGGDPGPVLAKVRSAGCKGVMVIETEPGYVAIMGDAASQGLMSQGIQWAFATSGFSNAVAQKIGSSADGTIAGSEFLPYTNSSPALSDFKSLMQQDGVPLDSFAEGGYIAANAAIAALKTVKGPYTVASVGAAFKAVNYSTPLLAKPYTFSTQPNKSIQIVTLKGGKWAPGTGSWTTIPK